MQDHTIISKAHYRAGLRVREKVIELFILCNGILVVAVLIGILVMLLIEGIPAFSQTSVWDFFTGTKWYPVSNPPTFGIFTFFISTIVVTVIATILAIPLGVGSAIYLAEIAKPKIRETVKPLIELLAGIPSIVMGVIGLALVTTVVREAFNLNTGLCGLTAGIMLAFMSVPIVVSISEDALSTVPKEFREASYALGATKWQTIIHVCVPAALSGITAAIMLGIGRAIGETMTVLMVAGGAIALNFSPLEPMRPMTAVIAAEINNAVRGGAQYHALFAIGLALFILTFFVNFAADQVLERQRRKFAR
ncbi:MAG TPA: phosphate ABC transporter permease subunit PstC [Dehalococcoidia bacterium]|nr:phosphate ABC transporter permease subunit PstC [Dehalococcoidia bacterium]